MILIKIALCNEQKVLVCPIFNYSNKETSMFIHEYTLEIPEGSYRPPRMIYDI